MLMSRVLGRLNPRRTTVKTHKMQSLIHMILPSNVIRFLTLNLLAIVSASDENVSPLYKYLNI